VHLFRGGTGEPVLFLHAAGGAGTWPEFNSRLAELFDVIAPDHPGFGKSDDFREADGADDLVYHYLDVLDALGLDTAHVVGASFGGWIAAELTVAAPHRVRSLTLVSAAGLRLPEHPVTDLARFCWVPYLSNPKLERRLHRITAPTLVVAPTTTSSFLSRTRNGTPSASLTPGTPKSRTAATPCTSRSPPNAPPSFPPISMSTTRAPTA
jgi:pimeloyl-ACP methyl ester carboxylesterase